MSDILRKSILQKTEVHIYELLKGEGSGHDWWHIHRVRNTALEIAKQEYADEYIVELAALLHDIADHKFHNGDETMGPKVAGNWLEHVGATKETIQHIRQIIADISYKGAGVDTPMHSLEGQIVQDADRLDAIGAIGIGRAFAYGGHKNREMYNPEKPPKLHVSFEAYKTDKGPTINHFYEKLFLLKDRMNTKAAKVIAEKRHQFMKEFLEQFYGEWAGKK